MYTLWLTFFREQMADYRELWGSHFAPDFDQQTAPCGLLGAPQPQVKSLGIVRQGLDVTMSLWRMRHWWGLTGPTSWLEMLSKPYCDSFRPREPVTIKANFGQPQEITGRDDCFAQVDMTPLEHHYRYCQRLQTTHRITYDALWTEPQVTLDGIADCFGLPRRPAVLPEGKVGYGT